jgi:hypothetical protein
MSLLLRAKDSKTGFSKNRSKYTVLSQHVQKALDIYRRKIFELCSLPLDGKNG